MVSAGPRSNSSQGHRTQDSDSPDVRALVNQFVTSPCLCCGPCGSGSKALPDAARRTFPHNLPTGILRCSTVWRRVHRVDSEVSDPLDSDASPEEAISDDLNAVSVLPAQHAFAPHHLCWNACATLRPTH